MYSVDCASVDGKVDGDGLSALLRAASDGGEASVHSSIERCPGSRSFEDFFILYYHLEDHLHCFYL